MQYRGSRQTVTGLTVNTKVNVRADYYRSSRSMADSLFKIGHYHRGDKIPIKSIAQIEGRLAHIYYVKERVPNRQKAVDKKAQKTVKPNEKDIHSSAIRTLYRRLLFFKHFIAAESPVILCEGKTDSIYLKLAIRHLPAFHQKLATVTQGSVAFAVRFFRYSRQAQDILELTGGTGDLANFIATYAVLVDGYQYVPLQHPVIIFTDNDSGAKPIFHVIKNKFYITANLETDLSFYHLCRNLFLVKTPVKGADGSSFVEEFFDPALLKTVVGGKTFNPHKDHDHPNEYGKALFAEHVVIPNASKID